MSAQTLGSAAPVRRSYGNWVQLRSPGLFGLGLAGTTVLLATPVVALLVLLVAGSTGALAVAVLGAVGFSAVGTPAGPALSRRARFAWHAHRDGHLALLPGIPPAVGELQLPGVGAPLDLLEGVDAAGAAFAVVHDRRRGGLWTLVLRCDADGPVMAETDQVDTWVASWGRFLATVGADPALAAVKVIVESAPDPGTRLATAIAGAASAGAPGLAGQVMAECAATYPVLAAASATWVEITYRGRLFGSRTERAAVLAELGRRLPGLVQQLVEAGGGAVAAATAAEVCECLRAAYPAGSGGQVSQSWESLTHGGAASVSWVMDGAPRSGVEATALGALLAPQVGLVGKRVALLLRPQPPDSSARAAEHDAATATFNAGGANVHGRVSAAASLRVRATEQARHEVAAGAVLVKFYLLATATVSDPSELDAAVAAVESAAGAVPLRLRRAHGAQASAFATTLPVGHLPHEHTLLPERLRGLV